jgi:DnaJ-class molecular chaperone
MDIQQQLKEALDILLLPTHVNQKEIKEQYRYLAQKYHPDKKGGSEEKMEKLNNAYAIIMQYINEYRYAFDEEEIVKQFPGVDHVQRFKP